MGTSTLLLVGACSFVGGVGLSVAVWSLFYDKNISGKLPLTEGTMRGTMKGVCDNPRPPSPPPLRKAI